MERPVDRPGKTFQNVLLTLPFHLLFFIQLAHHALWRDELNAFGIAVGSPTLPSLFAHIHYEGHPWLWYVLLWLVSKVTVYPVGMKVLEGMIGTGTFLMIGVASPFSRLVKILLFLSYFVTFEYTVMSRMYGVTLLLMLIYVQLRVAHPERQVRNAVLLGLIASTDSVGMLLSGALAVEYLLSSLQARAYRLTRPVLLAGLVWVAMVLAAIWSMKLTPDISWRTTGHLFTHARSIRHLGDVTLSEVAMPYLPMMNLHLGPFWNPNPWDHRALTIAVFFLVVGVYFYTFRKQRNLLIMLGLVIAGGILTGHLIYYGAERHFGITFLAFVAALWMLAARRGRIPGAACALLALCAVGGILTNIEEWRRPFSNAENTARWLKAENLADAPIAGTPDTSVASLGEILHRGIWQLECNCSDTFLLFSRRRDAFSPEQIPERILLARQRLGPRMLYITSTPLTPEEQQSLEAGGMTLKLIKSFTGAEVQYEDFYLYAMPQKATLQNSALQQSESRNRD